MKKYVKLVALTLIAVLMLGSLSACAGRSYTNMDTKATGYAQQLQKLYDDITETVKVDGGTQYVDAPAADTPTTDAPTTDEPTTDTPTTDEPTTDAPTTDEPSTDEPAGDDGDYADYNTVCMSFNVLQWDSHYSGYAAPAVRAPWILDTIKKYDPDLLGTQEVTKKNPTDSLNMYQYLVDGLADKYDHRSIMDDKTTPGSKVAVSDLTIATGLVIFWKKDRFELKDSGAQVYSVDSGRHFQWVKLYDKQEDITVVMTNTHFSINPGSPGDVTAGDNMRNSEAGELYNFWTKNCGTELPLYATGDYNHKSTTPAFGTLTQGDFQNSRDISVSANATSSIDYVFINQAVQTCYKYTRCNDTYEPAGVAKPENADKRNLEYCPSDHYAIVAYCDNGNLV